MSKPLKLPKKLNLNQNRKKQVFGGLLLFATLGSILVLVTRAAVPNIAFQSESATRSGTAELVSNDSSASGGSYVLFKGSGGGDGGYATRKCTAGNIPGSPVYLDGGDLAGALYGLQSGQTLVIGPGTYNANVNMESKSNITICANPSGGRPLVYGGIGFSNAANVHIEGLEFNGGGTAVGGITYSWGSTNMSAWDNWVHNFDQCGICSASGGGRIDIRYNRIWDNAHTSCFGGSGISNWAFSNKDSGNNSDGYNSYIIGNVLWDNYQSVPSTCIGSGEITDGNCIIIDAMDGSQGSLQGSTDVFAGRFLIANNTCANNGGRCINIFSSQRADVYHNTCYQNATSHQPSGNNEIGVVFSNDVKIKNNIVIAGTGLVHGQYQSNGVDISNNIWWGNGASVFGSNDQVIDPQITNPQLNPTQGDWRPRSISPAIGAGVGISVVPIDAAGKSRSGSPTLGAWEL